MPFCCRRPCPKHEQVQSAETALIQRCCLQNSQITLKTVVQIKPVANQVCLQSGLRRSQQHFSLFVKTGMALRCQSHATAPCPKAFRQTCSTPLHLTMLCSGPNMIPTRSASILPRCGAATPEFPEACFSE